jgi:hypothetical protein
MFWTFASRSEPQDNSLIGSPQSCQCLTFVRPGAVPATANDLLQMSGCVA